MLDKDRIEMVLEILDAGGPLCRMIRIALRKKLIIRLANQKEKPQGYDLPSRNPESIRRGLGSYLHRTYGSDKEKFIKSCMPMVAEKALVGSGLTFDASLNGARNLCTEMWEENAG